MALLDCPEGGQQPQKPEPEVGGPDPGAGKKSNRRKILIVALLAAAIGAVVLYKTCIVRTVDTGNGWSHQVGHFGPCDFDKYDHCGQATHRIYKSFATVGAYCEAHWHDNGSKLFERLAEKRPAGVSKEEAVKYYAQRVVENKLGTRLMVSYCAESEMTATNLEADRWEVCGYLEAETSQGTVVRQNWSVTSTLTQTGFRDYIVTFD